MTSTLDKIHTTPPTGGTVSPMATEECCFERIAQVGEGTYGRVYKAKCTRTDKLVALKRIKLEPEKEGFPLTSMREIRLLQRVNHPNVLSLHDIIYARGYVYMVFEYLEFDLNGMLTHPHLSPFRPEHVKCLLSQMLIGLEYLHSRGILHRDIKGSNILINRMGQLKLADFGLARLYSHQRQDCTNRVITMWYRPPELLLGATNYGPEVDIWGIGCLFVEMFTRKPLFPGNDELSQLHAIYKLLGSPVMEDWPEIDQLPWFGMIKLPKTGTAAYRSTFRKQYHPILTDLGLELAESMLAMNPKRRFSATEALESGYFREEPIACQPQELPLPKGDWHEFESKRRRKQQQSSKQTTKPPHQ